MRAVTFERFDEFFTALHGHPPYPWQRRLAELVVTGDWPGAIDLPTGSGKTACIDIAVYALACQASLPVEQRTTPRRIFFCVNRRVIVDEAHQRAERIATKIWDAERDGANTSHVLREFAAALRSLTGAYANDDAPPIDVLELRGGIHRDNRWARSITQPTIVCTTIDQLGSRLLFRGYGVSTNAAPIQAALIAYDSLILLDEAHISEPFRQTLENVHRYLEPAKWSEQDVGIQPTVVVPMTATPNDQMRQHGVIQLDEQDRQTESLRKRLSASKPAELRSVNDIVKETVKAACGLANGDSSSAVGVIVNRVASAKEVYEKLCEKRTDACVELVIGSMRPIDRDMQMQRLRKLVGPERPTVTEQTCFVVSTQCLEVGADYDFDVLITECASLDALRQRFGRLNRAGRDVEARAVILANKKDIKSEDKLDNDDPLDPIYGNALTRTWNWLDTHATDETIDEKPVKRIDFGIDALAALLREHAENGRPPASLLAPSALAHAPVMLPAYIDLWRQTSPRPTPDPDIALFLHGERRGEPDVQVCWRADLVEDDKMNADTHWVDVVALLPPTSAECMSVPISRLRRWLANPTTHADPDKNDSDLIGVSPEPDTPNGKRHRGDEETGETTIKGILWRGVNDSAPLNSPADLRPGDTLVLSVASAGWNELGHLPPDPSPESSESNTALIDRAEDAFLAARNRFVVRIHPALREAWPNKSDAIDALFKRFEEGDEPPTRSELCALLRSAATEIKPHDPVRADRLQHMANPSNLRCEPYPDACGAVLLARQRINRGLLSAIPALDDGDDQRSRTQRRESITLADHTEHVVTEINRALLLLPIGDMADAFRLAATLHDVGKSDERFQAMLQRTNRTDAWLLTGAGSAPLAKSDGMPQNRRERIAARARAGLPRGFRHEMLSVQLAQRSADLPQDALARDLVLHLIAAHHGYAQPFAPVVLDDDPPDVEVNGLRLTTAQRLTDPSHRLDSGVAERFWTLTHRFGWWGLAYLEAVLRLADQRASATEDTAQANAETQRTEEVASA